VKLYTEMVDDPKMIGLSDEAFRFWINSLCLAGKYDKGGELGNIKTIAWGHRIAEGKAKRLCQVLSRAGLFIESKHIWSIRNFAKRQMKPSDQPEATRERKRKSREITGDKSSHAPYSVTPESGRGVTEEMLKNVTPIDRLSKLSKLSNSEDLEPGIPLPKESISNNTVIGDPQIKKQRSEKQKANDLIHDAIAEVTKCPSGSFNGKVVADLRKELPDKAPEYIAAEIRRRFGVGGLWYQNDWRGKKGEAPKPQQIYPEWDRVLGGAQISVSEHNKSVIDQLIANGREKQNAR
jgi:hypothetical protein